MTIDYSIKKSTFNRALWNPAIDDFYNKQESITDFTPTGFSTRDSIAVANDGFVGFSTPSVSLPARTCLSDFEAGELDRYVDIQRLQAFFCLPSLY